MYLLDTDILVDIQRGYEPAVEWFESLAELPHIPGFVVMELVQDAPNKRELQKVLGLVEPFPVIWPVENDCQRALSDFSAYHLSHNLGLLDALIAACVLGVSARLYTFNTKHYQAIQDLEIEQPYPKASTEISS